MCLSSGAPTIFRVLVIDDDNPTFALSVLAKVYVPGTVEVDQFEGVLFYQP